MKQALSLLGTISALASLSFLSSCSSELGDESEDGDGTGGAVAGTGGETLATGGAPGTGGSATGGAPGSGGGIGTGGGTDGTGGAPEVVYSPGFTALRDVLSGFKIGRPDYSCASSDCHSGGSETTMVPLRLVQDEGLYAELTSHVSAKCGNLKAVEPGSPESSAIVKVLREGCADVTPPDEPIPRMPFGCVENEFENTCVDDAHIATIEQWIADGAPEF